MSVADVVLALSAELRSSGVPVSLVETEDALRALTSIPLEDRSAVRTALAATMVKEPTARPTFDRLFEVFFPLTRAAQETVREGDSGEGLPEVNKRLGDALRDMDMERLKEIADELVEREADVDPNARVSDDHYRYRALRNLDLEDLLTRLVEQEVAGKGMSSLERRLIEEDFEHRMRRFSEQVSEEVRRRRRQGLDVGRQIAQERKTPPEEVDFIWATHADLEAMRAALYPLSRRLALRLSNKRREARRGRLDVRKTIRRSLSFGGAMVEPRFRKPSAGKPELWILCDISGSMRNFTRFTLELVYAIATQFQRVRSFVFIDGLDEVTDKLDVSGDFARALERIDDEADVIAIDGQSWYGNAFARFWARYGREVTPRTTAIVLGDCRNNYRTSGAEVVRDLRRQALHLWWLNPEPVAYWDSADSIAGEFSVHTDGMFECRNLKQLESFVARAL